MALSNRTVSIPYILAAVGIVLSIVVWVVREWGTSSLECVRTAPEQGYCRVERARLLSATATREFPLPDILRVGLSGHEHRDLLIEVAAEPQSNVYVHPRYSPDAITDIGRLRAFLDSSEPDRLVIEHRTPWFRSTGP